MQLSNIERVGELDDAGLGKIPGNSRVRQIRLSCDDSDFTVIEARFYLSHNAVVSTEAWGCSRLTVVPSSSPRARTPRVLKLQATTRTTHGGRRSFRNRTRIVYN